MPFRSTIAPIGIEPDSDRTSGGIDREVSLSCSSGMIKIVGLTPTLSAIVRFATPIYDIVCLGPSLWSVANDASPLLGAVVLAHLGSDAIGTNDTSHHGASLHSLSLTRDRLARTPTVHFPCGSGIAAP